MEKFSIWDLKRVHIRVNKAYFKEINKKLFSRFKSKEKAWKSIFNNKGPPFATFKNMLKESHSNQFFVPLAFLTKIIQSLGLKKEDLQKNVIAYKTAGGINYIKKPILPIKIGPVFDILFAHHLGDGTVINPKRGRLPYFGYRQFNPFYRISYIKKIEDVFGKIHFKEKYFEKSTRPYCPPVLSTLFFKYYSLTEKDFLSEIGRIPQIIFKKGKESLLAVLIGFIIDEGNIDSTQIIIHLKNERLINDLKRICDYLKYECKLNVHKELNKNYWRLYVLREGMKKFYKDYQDLNKKYPVIDLGIKGEKILASFKIFNRKIIRIKGNRNLILSILKKEKLSVNQIAERINMTRQGVRYHINSLIKDKKIRLIDTNELNWIYGI